MNLSMKYCNLDIRNHYFGLHIEEWYVDVCNYLENLKNMLQGWQDIGFHDNYFLLVMGILVIAWQTVGDIYQDIKKTYAYIKIIGDIFYQKYKAWT